MLHPSYTDLMQLVNSEVESGEAPVVNSRYSIVLAEAAAANARREAKKKEAEEMDEMVFSLDEEDDVEAEAADTADEMSAEEE